MFREQGGTPRQNIPGRGANSTVQLQVFRKQGSTPATEVDRDTGDFQVTLRFYDAVGWITRTDSSSSKKEYDRLQFNLNAPQGQLPCYSGNTVNRCYTSCDSGRAPGRFGGPFVTSSESVRCGF